MSVYVASALAIVVVMLGTWLLSLVLRNASIVDIVWGLGFVVVGWVSFLTTDETGSRQTVLLVLVTIWGARLGAYLLWRNAGKGEDFRYVKMRKHWGPRFPIISLATVFTLQGVLMYLGSLPVQYGMTIDPDHAVGPIGYLGELLWAVGMFFEAVGDWQLARFKADPANAGKIMDRGLWRYTRHPNYFGDFAVWWGIWLVVIDAGLAGWWTVIGPVVMTVLLVRVSGKGLLERNLKRRRPGYDEYIARTSGFFPWPPKQTA